MSAEALAVFERGLELLRDNDIARFAELYAEDAVVEFPFAPEGRPRRLEGRAAVAEYLADYPGTFRIRDVTVTAVHQTPDPAVIVAEYTAEGVLVATGEPYEAHYVVVLAVKDGRIAHYRDYWNPSAFRHTTYGGKVA